MQLLTIIFTPGNSLPSKQPFFVTFKAQWGEKITTGVFRFPLSPDQIRVLISLLQEYVDPHRRNKLAQDPLVQKALQVLGTRVTPKAQSVSVEQLPKLMGIALFEALFQSGSHVEKLWDTFHDSATQHKEEEHRIVLHFIERQDCKASIHLLIALPWELLESKKKEDPFLVAQDSTFTLVRTYQPAESFQKPSQDHDPTEEPTSILLLETEDDTLKFLAKMVRPPELIEHKLNGYKSLWCRMRTYPWGDSAHQLKPQIIHVVAHGMRHQNRNWILYGSGDDENSNVIGPYKFASALQDAGSTTVLIVSFVCHSGVTNENNSPDSNLSPSGRSLLGELTNVAPALLLMQGLILDDDAVKGSEALYETIANGEGIALAVREMRKKIYPEPRDIRHETSWWIPTLYLRNPQAELCLVILKKEDAARKALILPSDLLKVLDSVHEHPTLIMLQCETKGGKSVRLRRIADHLQSKGRKCISISTDKANDGWFQDATLDIATYVRACYHMSPEYRDAVYSDEVCKEVYSRFEPVFVLCDDGDRLMEEHWRQLFPPNIKARLIFITTTSEPLTINIPHVKHSSIELSPLTNEELRALQRPALEKFRENRPDTIDSSLFDTLSTVFFAARTALTVETLAGIAACSARKVRKFLEHAINHQIVTRNKENNGKYYKSEIESLLLDNDDYIDFISDIQNYINNLIEKSEKLPQDIINIFIEHDGCGKINLIPYKEENAPLWWRWIDLATQLSSDAFARIALHQSRQSPYNRYTIVRDGLHYLILTRGKLIPPEFYAGELCHILWPEQGRRIDPSSSSDFQDPVSNGILDVSDERIEAFITHLQQDEYKDKYPNLLITLQKRFSNVNWHQDAYDVYRNDIINYIQDEYDKKIGEKCNRTEVEFQKSRKDIPYLRHLDINKIKEWLNKLVDGMLNEVLTQE